jgi:hypothetical protein
MNYIITKHARQRRKHHKIVDEKILLDLLEQLEIKYQLPNLPNNTYKIYHKGITAIVKKEDDALILITQRGFKSVDYSLGDIPFKITASQSKKEKLAKQYKKQGVVFEVYRINFKNKKVVCGTICDLLQSKDKKDTQYKNRYRYKLSLDPKLFSKYYIPTDIKIDTYCNKLNELFYIIELKNNSYFLKNFKRKMIK